MHIPGFTIDSEITGQCWFLPRDVVFKSYEAHYGSKDDYEPSEADEETLIDWLQNNFNWDEIEPHLIELPRNFELDAGADWPNMNIQPFEYLPSPKEGE